MVASAMSGLAGLIALMPEHNVNASAHSILAVSDDALLYLRLCTAQDIQLNTNHGADLQVACYDALAAVGSKVRRTVWAGAHQVRLQSYHFSCLHLETARTRHA